jgi:subtilisin family serine protease
MNSGERLLRAASARRGAVVLVVVAVLVLPSLAVVVLFIRSPAEGERTPAKEPTVASPALDDVPDATIPRQLRPGTAGAAVPPQVVRVVADQILVKFEEGTSPETAEAALAHARVQPRGRIAKTGTRVVGVPPARRATALAALAASPAVEYAESDVLLQIVDTVPNDTRWPEQWGATKVAAPRAWDTARGSSSVVVAVLDTGVDFNHYDLRAASVPGYDFVNADSDPSDDHGHGTAAAGVAAARTNNGAGVAGVCWTCSLMSVKVLDANGSGSTSTIARGIVWAADRGVRIINLSLGGPSSTQTLADAVAYAASKGVILVAAAGNNGTSTPFFPAAYPEVVAVAATDGSDRRYSWSNYGSWVQVAAPGCNLAPVRGGGYGSFCGTSSATPIVAGLAGLALSARVGATRGAVETAIKSASVPIGSAVQNGRVNAAGTLVALGVSGGTTTSPTLVSATAKGRITRRYPTRIYKVKAARGKIVARLSFRGARRLTLSIRKRDGTRLRRVSGSSPVRVAKKVRAGTFKLVVHGKNVRRATFTLRVSYPKP